MHSASPREMPMARYSLAHAQPSQSIRMAKMTVFLTVSSAIILHDDDAIITHDHGVLGINLSDIHDDGKRTRLTCQVLSRCLHVSRGFWNM